MNSTINSEYRVGQFVKTVASPFGGPSRRSRIVEITTNSYGTTIYVLADGGRLGANEISAR